MKKNLPLQIGLSQSTVLIIKKGDLTQEPVDVIVNAANQYLEHGGGIARAISIQGGSTIDRESRDWIREHGKVSHLSPAVTSAGNMPAQYVFHAVGPVWGSGDEEQKLKQAIQGCLLKMDEMCLTSIAFPAISTGIFGFPKPLAAKIFFETFKEYFKIHPDTSLHEVYLVLFDVPTINAFLSAFNDSFQME